MKRWDRLSRGFRQLRWGVSVFTGTLSMAAGIFTAGTVQRFRLWKISKLVWIPPAVWTAGGFLGVCRQPAVWSAAARAAVHKYAAGTGPERPSPEPVLFIYKFVWTVIQKPPFELIHPMPCDKISG